jgi:adenylyltransferase/sulfurtransferase
VKNITAEEFKNNLENWTILDVRTPREWDGFNFGGIHIPMDDLLARTNELEKEKEYLILCYNGTQSLIACRLLEAKGFKKLIHLDGGIENYLGS